LRRQAIRRITLAPPSIKPPHQRTSQRQLPIRPLLLLPIQFRLLRRLGLGGADETSHRATATTVVVVAGGTSGLELDRIGIQTLEHPPRLFVHDATTGPSGLGRAQLLDATVFAHYVVVDVGPGGHGIAHSTISLSLFLSGEFLLPGGSRMMMMMMTLSIVIVLFLPLAFGSRRSSIQSVVVVGSISHSHRRSQ